MQELTRYISDRRDFLVQRKETLTAERGESTDSIQCDVLFHLIRRIDDELDCLELLEQKIEYCTKEVVDEAVQKFTQDRTTIKQALQQALVSDLAIKIPKYPFEREVVLSEFMKLDYYGCSEFKNAVNRVFGKEEKEGE